MIDLTTDRATYEKIRGPLERLCTAEIALDIDTEKTVQLANARKNVLYYQGKQFLVPVRRGDQVVDWSPVTGNLVGVGIDGTKQARTYDYVVNYIRGDGDKAIAVLSQRAPSVKAVPDDPNNNELRRRSTVADRVAAILRSHWDVEEIQRAIAYHQWTSGPAFLYTPFVASAAKYGTTQVPAIETQLAPGDPYYECFNCGATTDAMQAGMPPMCPTCGAPLTDADMRDGDPYHMPVVGQPKVYSNGSVECIVASVFEVTTPFWIKSLADCPWLWYEYKTHKGKLLTLFPELREIEKATGFSGGSTSISNTAQAARDIISSPTRTQTPRSNQWLFSRVWLRPEQYELLADTGDAGFTRELLISEHPDGAKVTLVNGRMLRVEPERLDEVWTVVKPRSGDYLYADPLCQDYIGPQDVINDTYNIAVETAERAIPFSLYDPLVIDPAMIDQNRATPAEMIPARPGSGGSLRDSVYKVEAADFEPQVMQLAESSRDSARENVGVMRAMFGGDEGHEQTKGEAVMKRNQAMMQFNVPWNYMRHGLASAKENAALQLAKYSGGKIFTRRQANMPPQSIEVPGIEDLALGGWHYEAQEQMPMNWADRSDRVWAIFQQPPPAWPVLGVPDPANGLNIQNLPEYQEAMGLPDWSTPYLDAYNKASEIIRQLSQQEPMVGPMGEPIPSIPVDEFEDDHMFMAQMVKNWAQKKEALDLRESNPAFYANVIAWGKGHFMLAQPPMPVGPDGQPMGPGGPPPDAAPPDEALHNQPPAGPPLPEPPPEPPVSGQPNQVPQ